MAMTLPTHFGKNAPKVTCENTGMKCCGKALYICKESGKYYERRNSGQHCGIRTTWVFTELDTDVINQWIAEGFVK